MVQRTRGYLPHREIKEVQYFVTFRLADTLPAQALLTIKNELLELRQIATQQNRTLPPQEEQRLKYLETRKIQQYLDNGYGECFLKDKRIAQIVMNSIMHFDGIRYVSHACCIMPNHLHWLFSTIDSQLATIVHSVKSFSAQEANKLLSRSGAFWGREYYDHIVRSSEEFGRILMYILNNPVKAGFCKSWLDWPWTTCSEVIRKSLEQQSD